MKPSHKNNPHIAERKCMSDTDMYWTFETAAAFGGSFFKALADAGLKGDPRNRRRILNEFSEMLPVYGPGSPLHRQLRHGGKA